MYVATNYRHDQAVGGRSVLERLWQHNGIVQSALKKPWPFHRDYKFRIVETQQSQRSESKASHS